MINDKRINEIIAEQGWNDESLADLALDFIEESRLVPEFREFLKDAAEVENDYNPIN